MTAPFSPGQVASLNGYQLAGTWHEFTCGSDDCPRVGSVKAVLVAAPGGWRCPAIGCSYRQDWAHGFMADWSWNDGAGPVLRESPDGNPVSAVPSEPALELLETARELLWSTGSEFPRLNPRWDSERYGWLGRYKALVAEYAAAKAGKVAEAEPEPVPPLPPGDYGRIEIPGFRNHVGWWTDGLMAGQPVMVCSDRNGKVLARYIPGPGFRFVDLEVPSVTVQQEDPAAIEWRADPDDDDPDGYVAHARGCHDEHCNGDCVPF